MRRTRSIYATGWRKRGSDQLASLVCGGGVALGRFAASRRKRHQRDGGVMSDRTPAPHMTPPPPYDGGTSPSEWGGPDSYSGTASPESPSSLGKFLSWGRPSFIGSTVSA